jgi:hypothetical protein
LTGEEGNSGRQPHGVPVIYGYTVRVFVDDVRNSSEVGPYAVGVAADESAEDQ